VSLRGGLTRWTSTDGGGLQRIGVPDQRPCTNGDERWRAGSMAFTPWRSWVRVPQRPPPVVENTTKSPCFSWSGAGFERRDEGSSATTHRLSPDRAADPTVSGTLQSSGLDGPTRSEETVGDLTVHRSKPVPDAAIPQEVARPREPQRQPGRRPESLVDTLRMMRSTIRPTGHELIPDSGSTRRCRADHERRDAPTRRWSISQNWLQNSSRRSVEPAQPH